MRRQVVIGLALVLIAAAGIVHAQDLYYTREAYPLCLSEKALDQFLDFARQKDSEAMASLFKSGRCVLTKPNILGYRESQGYKTGTTGKIRFRPKGDTTSFWTVKEAIVKK